MNQFVNLKSNFYFLQKLLFAIFCFVLGFLLGSGILKVKAVDDDYTQYYYSNNLNYCDGFDFSEKLKDLEEELKKTGYYYSLVLTYRLPPNKTICYDTLSVNIFNEKPVISNFTFSNNKIFYNSNHRYLLFTNAPNEDGMNVAIDRVKNLSPNVTFGTSSNDFPLIARYSTSNYVLYSSNFDIYNKSNNSLHFHNETTSKIVTVSPDGTIPKIKDEITNKTYTENYRFSTKNIDRVEYTFEIPDNLLLMPDFNYSVTWEYESATLDNLNYPYLTWESDSATAVLQLKTGAFSDTGQVGYSDTISRVFTKPPVGLKYVVLVDSISSYDNSSMFIHFDSPFPFSRTVIDKTGGTTTPEEPAPPNQNIVDSIDKVDEYLKDDTPPNADISGLGNVTGLLPSGPVDSLLNIPAQFLSVVTSSLGGQCKPLTGTWVYDQPLTFPCFDEVIWNDVKDETLMKFLELIPSAFILVMYFKHLYKKVERATSMSTNSDDEWGVI